MHTAVVVVDVELAVNNAMLVCMWWSYSLHSLLLLLLLLLLLSNG